MIKSRYLRLLLAALGASTSLFVAGCNLVAPIPYLLTGPPKTQKLFALDPKRPTVVFIDDRSTKLPNRTTRRTIGETVERRLLAKANIERMLSSADLMAIADRERFGEPMGIAELGDAIGAEIIIYVTVDAFSLNNPKGGYAPAAAGRIIVVEVATKKQIFPEEGPRLPVAVDIPQRSREMPKSTGELSKEQIYLAQTFGDALANVFITHTTNELGTMEH